MNPLKPNILFKLEELFSEKGWNSNYSNDNHYSLFNRFCSRLSLLTDEQQLLVIELSYGYTLIELKNYLEKFYDSLISLGDDTFNQYDKIFVYPLLSPFKVSPKTKSAGFLHYMFDTDDYTWLSEKFIPNTSLKYLQYNFDNTNSILLLIDDYVGSGETAVEVCSEYLSIPIKEGNINREHVKVVSIAAQHEGINLFKIN